MLKVEAPTNRCRSADRLADRAAVPSFCSLQKIRVARVLGRLGAVVVCGLLVLVICQSGRALCVEELTALLGCDLLPMNLIRGVRA